MGSYFNSQRVRADFRLARSGLFRFFRERFREGILPASRAAAVCALLVITATAALAGSYNPPLGLGRAEVLPSGSGWVLTINGEWEFHDILQINYPLAILVSQGENFVRIPVGAPPVSGQMPALQDGFDTSEIVELETRGTPEPEAQLLRLEPRVAEIRLPASLQPGTVDVTLYVVLQHDLPPDHERFFASNTVAAELAR